jgi:hypothetical protein
MKNKLHSSVDQLVVAKLLKVDIDRIGREFDVIWV